MRWVSKGSRAARRRRQQRGGRRTRAPTPVGGSEQAQEALTRTEGNPEAEGPPSPTRPRSGPRQGACATSLARPRSPLLQVPPLTPGLASASAAGESGESRTRAATRVRGRTLPTPQHLCAGDTPTAAAGGARFSHFRDGCRAREGAQAACARRPAQAQPPGGGAGTQDARAWSGRRRDPMGPESCPPPVLPDARPRPLRRGSVATAPPRRHQIQETDRSKRRSLTAVPKRAPTSTVRHCDFREPFRLFKRDAAGARRARLGRLFRSSPRKRQSPEEKRGTPRPCQPSPGPWGRLCPPLPNNFTLNGAKPHEMQMFGFLTCLIQARSPVISRHRHAVWHGGVREASAKCGAPCGPPGATLPAGSARCVLGGGLAETLLSTQLQIFTRSWFGLLASPPPRPRCGCTWQG